jgi:hypothetical protein
MVGGMEEATEEVVGAIMGDTLTATAMAITGDMDMVGGVILIGEVIPTGGTALIIPIIILTTILITMRAMEGRRCRHKRLHLRQNSDDSNLLIGTSVRSQRVTTPTLKIARVAG